MKERRRWSGAAKELDDIYNKIIGSKESYLIPSYAKENKNELVAEMANPAVREPLKKMGMWTRLVNAVKKFFMGEEKQVAVDAGFAKEEDFGQSTVYNELSKTLDKFLNNFDEKSYDAYVALCGGDRHGKHFRIELGETFSNDKEHFDAVRERAIKEKGIVLPNLKKESVKVVKVEEHKFGNETGQSLDNAEKWARENLVTTGKDKSNLPTMRDGTPYTISKKAVGKYLSESAVEKSENLNIHLSVLPKLTDVIHESIESEIHPDYNKDENDNRYIENGYGKNVLVHRLYGAVELDGKTYRVKTTMQEFRGSEENKPHSYEVTKIELLEGPRTAKESDSPHLDSATNNSISTAKLLEGVEKSYDKGKKLLDESRDLTDGETSFRVDNKNSQSSTPVTDTVANIGKVVEKTSKKLGVKVHAVSHISEITDPQVRRDIMRGKKVQGWYDEKTGEVHLYLPNIHDSYTAEKTVWHETVGHKGMRGLLGDLILAILQVRNELNCFEHVFLSCVTKRKLSLYSTAVSPSNTISTKAHAE